MDRSSLFLLDGDVKGSEIRHISHIALSPIVAARFAPQAMNDGYPLSHSGRITPPGRSPFYPPRSSRGGSGPI
jgi:hypothetical protein